jgi:hypothetical protein
MPVFSRPAAPGGLDSGYDDPYGGEEESGSDGDVPPEPETDGDADPDADADGDVVTVANQLTCTSWLVGGDASGSAAATGLTGFQSTTT